jgi:hypothetical protein
MHGLIIEIDKLQKPNNSMDLGDFNQEATLGQESDIVFAMDFILRWLFTESANC